mmetsp:Transcript_2008/g.6316  ORF Transcript_2008/g.6316 Transcript_2008/m.6316 type:complete len:207 (-) Transcript_2008:364-984(-)
MLGAHVAVVNFRTFRSVERIERKVVRGQELHQVRRTRQVVIYTSTCTCCNWGSLLFFHTFVVVEFPNKRIETTFATMATGVLSVEDLSAGADLQGVTMSLDLGEVLVERGVRIPRDQCPFVQSLQNVLDAGNIKMLHEGAQLLNFSRCELVLLHYVGSQGFAESLQAHGLWVPIKCDCFAIAIILMELWQMTSDQVERDVCPPINQ